MIYDVAMPPPYFPLSFVGSLEAVGNHFVMVLMFL
jgi:hypothetical protein